MWSAGGWAGRATRSSTPSSTGKGGGIPSSTSPCGVTMHSRAGAAALGVTAQPSPVGSPPFCCRRNLVSVKQTYQYPDTQPGDEDAFSREPFIVWFQSPKTSEMLSAMRRPSIALPTLQQPGLHGCACAGSRAGAGSNSTARPTSSARPQLMSSSWGCCHYRADTL